MRWELMTQLMADAVASPRRFASGSRTLGDSGVVYGLVQCRRDLKPGQCSDCLGYLIDQLLGNYPNNTAAFIKGFSCFAKYHPEPIALMDPPPAGNKLT
jgi:hypothetical protein